MWTSENERLGFRQCTRAGYALVSCAYPLLVGGGLGLGAMGCFLAVKALSGPKISSGLWSRSLLVVSLLLGIMLAGWLAQRVGWAIARRRGFVYDYTSDTCDWEGRNGRN